MTTYRERIEKIIDDNVQGNETGNYGVEDAAQEIIELNEFIIAEIISNLPQHDLHFNRTAKKILERVKSNVSN